MYKRLSALEEWTCDCCSFLGVEDLGWNYTALASSRTVHDDAILCD